MYRYRYIPLVCIDIYVCVDIYLVCIAVGSTGYTPSIAFDSSTTMDTSSMELISSYNNGYVDGDTQFYQLINVYKARIKRGETIANNKFYYRGCFSVFKNTLSASDVEVAGMELLWENPNPTAQFNPQTIALDLNKYSYIGVSSNFSTGSAGLYPTKIDVCKKGNSYVIINRYTSSDQYFSNRMVNSSDSGVTFQTGYNTSTAGNAYAIPTKIYGIIEKGASTSGGVSDFGEFSTHSAGSYTFTAEVGKHYIVSETRFSSTYKDPLATITGATIIKQSDISSTASEGGYIAHLRSALIQATSTTVTITGNYASSRCHTVIQVD